jgi:beta-glucosidase
VFGEDAGEGQGPNACADRGCNQGTLACGWGSGAVEFPYLVSPLKGISSVIDPDQIELSHHLTNNPPFKKNPGILANLDICIVFINADSGEGYIRPDGISGDRNDLYPQKGGDQLVKTVAHGCGKGKGKTIVVVHSVGPVIVERWADLPGVKAIIMAHLPGQESGNAIADILFGNANPSGKLPYTIGRSEDDYGKNSKVMYYPNAVIPQANFSEGLYVDYRYFDKYSITPRYEFGFGLSYTTFSFSNLTVTLTKPKYHFPAMRSPSPIAPPDYNETLPDPSTAVFPPGFRKLHKYIYPYLSSTDVIKPGRYPYPDGYEDEQPPSPAGGGEGGNPALWEVLAEVTLTITNTGKMAGAEVAQLYISYPPVVPKDPSKVFSARLKDDEILDMPVRVLRGFEKVYLEPNESKEVKFELTRKDLSYWNVVAQNWLLPTEYKFGVHVGSSSRKFLQRGEL